MNHEGVVICVGGLTADRTKPCPLCVSSLASSVQLTPPPPQFQHRLIYPRITCSLFNTITSISTPIRSNSTSPSYHLMTDKDISLESLSIKQIISSPDFKFLPGDLRTLLNSTQSVQDTQQVSSKNKSLEEVCRENPEAVLYYSSKDLTSYIRNKEKQLKQSTSSDPIASHDWRKIIDSCKIVRDALNESLREGGYAVPPTENLSAWRHRNPIQWFWGGRHRTPSSWMRDTHRSPVSWVTGNV